MQDPLDIDVVDVQDKLVDVHNIDMVMEQANNSLACK